MSIYIAHCRRKTSNALSAEKGRSSPLVPSADYGPQFTMSNC